MNLPCAAKADQLCIRPKAGHSKRPGPAGPGRLCRAAPFSAPLCLRSRLLGVLSGAGVRQRAGLKGYQTVQPVAVVTPGWPGASPQC